MIDPQGILEEFAEAQRAHRSWQGNTFVPMSLAQELKKLELLDPKVRERKATYAQGYWQKPAVKKRRAKTRTNDPAYKRAWRAARRAAGQVVS